MIRQQVISVRIGEIGFGSSGERLQTLLGSCVGVLLFDRDRKRAGLAHVQLPESNPSSNFDHDPLGKYADVAVAELVRQLGPARRLIAHLAGGADMFQTSRVPSIGTLNQWATQRLVNELRIPIETSEFGGTLARRLCFDIDSGSVQIETVQKTQAIKKATEMDL